MDVNTSNTQLFPTKTNETIPNIDSMNIWQLIDGSNETSPRTIIPLSSVDSLYGSGYIHGNYKVVLGTQNGLGFFTGPQSPNATNHYQDAGCPKGCLFDIINDPTEHIDIQSNNTQIFTQLMNEMYAISNTSYQTDCYGIPINSSEAETNANNQKVANGGVWGPYNMCLMNN